MATNDVPVQNIIDEIENIGVNRKSIDMRNLLYKNGWSAFVATVPKESERVLYNADLAKKAIVRPFRKNHRKTKQILRPSTSLRQNTQTRHQNHRPQHHGKQWNNHKQKPKSGATHMIQVPTGGTTLATPVRTSITSMQTHAGGAILTIQVLTGETTDTKIVPTGGNFHTTPMGTGGSTGMRPAPTMTTTGTVGTGNNNNK